MIDKKVNSELYINFEEGVYHIHLEPTNYYQPVKYLCGLSATEDISFRKVDRKYLRAKNINSGANPLCRHYYNVLTS